MTKPCLIGSEELVQTVDDSSLTASSVWPGYEAPMARMTSTIGWHPAESQSNGQWVQVSYLYYYHHQAM